jgi:hypothetical protein
MRRFVHLAILTTLILLTGLTLSSCSKPQNAAPGVAPSTAAPTSIFAPPAPTITVSVNACLTGSVVDRDQLINQANLAQITGISTQADSYAVVSYQWLSTTMGAYQQELFNHGIQVSVVPGSANTGWAQSFNCVDFATSFRAFAAYRYHNDTRSISDPPPFLAICTITYVTDTEVAYAKAQNPQITPESHQILWIYTDRGGVFFDPQIGITTLSQPELLSITFKQA